MQTLKSLIDAHERITAFTGAGISTESGIPDFRSPGGVWTKYRPIEFEDFMASEEMRRESWRRKMGLDKVIQKSKPNRNPPSPYGLGRHGAISVVGTPSRSYSYGCGAPPRIWPRGAPVGAPNAARPTSSTGF